MSTWLTRKSYADRCVAKAHERTRPESGSQPIDHDVRSRTCPCDSNGTQGLRVYNSNLAGISPCWAGIPFDAVAGEH